VLVAEELEQGETAHLVVNHNSRDDGCPQTRRHADAEAADHTANGNIPQHALVPCLYNDQTVRVE
jgi:hypothetical protein